MPESPQAGADNGIFHIQGIWLRGVDRQQANWEKDHLDCRVIKTYPVELVPLEFHKPAFEFAPMPPAQPPLRMRIDFERAK
jgi:hypothetical protein